MFVAVIVVFGLVLVAAARHVRKISARWIHAARDLGLQATQPRFGMPTITGTMRGLQVKVDMFRQGSGKNAQTFTRYSVHYPPPDFDFRLTRETGLSRTTRLFGAQDVEVGETGFGAAFVTKTDDEERLKGWLDAGRMGVLVRTAAAYPGLVLNSGEVKFQRNGLESSHDVIVSTVRRLVDVADALSGRQANTRTADVVAARARGDLAEMATRLRGLKEKRSEALDEQLMEIDTLATAGERDAAEQRVRALEEILPADPDVMGWKRRLKRPGVSADTDTRPGPGAEELAQELFAGNALSFESKKVFDERHRGATVRWPGVVKAREVIRAGSNVGPEGATKLIVTVAAITHDLYGNTEVDAVIGLPPNAAATVGRGDDVTITGTLARVDPLVRNIFLTDAALV